MIMQGRPVHGWTNPRTKTGTNYLKFGILTAEQITYILGTLTATQDSKKQFNHESIVTRTTNCHFCL